MVSSSQSLSQCSYSLNNEISTKIRGDRRGIRECKKVIKELDIRIGPVEWAERDLDRWGLGIETQARAKLLGNTVTGGERRELRQWKF